MSRNSAFKKALGMMPAFVASLNSIAFRVPAAIVQHFSKGE